MERITEMLLDLRVQVARLDERSIADLRWRASAEKMLTHLSRTSTDSTHQLQQHSRAIGQLEERQTTVLKTQDAVVARRHALALAQWAAVILTVVLAAAKIIPEEWTKVIFALVLGK